jgi:SAM-dependent methyltransferase
MISEPPSDRAFQTSSESMRTVSKWPKQMPRLTPEQQKISDEWMEYFHEVIGTKFPGVVDFNHNYVVKHSSPGFVSSLDVGAGLGEHLAYENLTSEQLAAYVALELRQNMAQIIREKWLNVQICTSDCQQRLPFKDGHFDRIIAIHVLEHLPNLPAFLREARRLLNKVIGRLLVVIPCEGGLMYSLGRQVTSKSMFQKRYNWSYDEFIATEHVNEAAEIFDEIDQLFCAENKSYYPMLVPSLNLNLCVGMTLRPRE